MPSVEYCCQSCKKTFVRLVFRGEKDDAVLCPRCGSPDIAKPPAAEGLFNGIATSSALASDHN